MGTSAGDPIITKDMIAVPPGTSSSGAAIKTEIEEESNLIGAIPRFAGKVSPDLPEYDALVDSGSQGTLISKDIVLRDNIQTLPLEEAICLVTATGGREIWNECVELNPCGAGPIVAKVAPLKSNSDVILGYDWMTRVGAVYDFGKGRMTITGKDGRKKTLWQKGAKRFGL